MYSVSTLLHLLVPNDMYYICNCQFAGKPGWHCEDLPFSNALLSLAQIQYVSSGNEGWIFSQYLRYWKGKLGFDLIIFHQSVSQCESNSGMGSSLWVYPGSPHTQLPDHTTALRKNLYQAATKDTGEILFMPCPNLLFSVHLVYLIFFFTPFAHPTLIFSVHPIH